MNENVATVFLVDDDESFLTSVARLFRASGMLVKPFSSAADFLAQRPPEAAGCVVADLQMPGMSGIEVLGAIKKLKPLTEVLMLTGHATIEAAIEGMKMGAFDFLLKPCKIDVLIEKINKANERKSEHEERIRKAIVDKLSTSPMSVFEK